jgi:hypothetical protein
VPRIPPGADLWPAENHERGGDVGRHGNYWSAADQIREAALRPLRERLARADQLAAEDDGRPHHPAVPSVVVLGEERSTAPNGRPCILTKTLEDGHECIRFRWA